MIEQRRPAIPRRARACGNDIIAEAGRYGDRDEALEAELGREIAELADDAFERRLREADQIDLVNRQHHMADAEQRGDIGVPAGLHQNALACIDQYDGELGIGGARRHVAGVLLVARRVGHDEFALLGGEEAVGDVDGDALLAFGF